MGKVEAIKHAIEELTQLERAELDRWLDAGEDQWDRQIAADAQAGRLDDLIRQADADIDSGNLREFP